MAHEIESMAYVASRGLPWHGLGEPLGNLASASEMLTAAKLDWQVEPKPIVVQGTNTPIKGKVANVRSTDGEVLGVVGDRYQVIQNDEMMSFADALLDAGAVFETAASLRGGQVVFAAMELPEGITIEGDNGKTRSFVVVANGHNGLFPLKAMITPVRVVCMNTLNAALGSAKMSFTLRHTAKVEGRVAEAKRTLGIAHQVSDEFRIIAGEMIKATLLESEINAIVNRVFPLSPDEARDQAKISERAASTLAILKNADNLDGLRDTKWGVYNAVAEYLDHGVSYRGGKRSTAADAKASSVMLDTGSATKIKKEALAIIR